MNRMKFSKIYIALLVAAAIWTGCKDEMDYQESDDSINFEYVSDQFQKIAGLLAPIYNSVDYDLSNNNKGALLASATDEAVYSHAGNVIESFYNGAWSAVNPLKQTWDTCWAGIAYSNHYLDNFLGLTCPEWELDKNYQALYHRYYNERYEVRFLRAYFYFVLARQYGGVPIKTGDLSASESNALPRASVDEVFKFIEDECNAIVDSIVVDYSNLGSYGLGKAEDARANRLAVLALRARAALYYASPLFNTSNDKSRWEKAAKYNQQVIDEAISKYSMGLVQRTVDTSMVEVFEALFGESNKAFCAKSGEVIWGRRTTSDNKFETTNFPVGVNTAGGGNCPTQNLVDAFEMRNGKAIDDANSNYNPQNPYANRDLRLAATVAVVGEYWPNGNTHKLESYYGGSNALPTPYGTPTGYYLKKYCKASQYVSSTKDWQKSFHTWVTFRLAEFYLNYAEAVLNVTGSGYDNGGYSMTPAEAINVVRNRAGQPNIAEGLSFDEFKARYENERFVELAFEGHRFFDVRRWKEATKYFTTIKTMDIRANFNATDTTYTFTPKVDNTTRQWNDKMYLFPIPQSDMLNNAGGWEQNPGW